MESGKYWKCSYELIIYWIRATVVINSCWFMMIEAFRHIVRCFVSHPRGRTMNNGTFAHRVEWQLTPEHCWSRLWMCSSRCSVACDRPTAVLQSRYTSVKRRRVQMVASVLHSAHHSPLPQRPGAAVCCWYQILTRFLFKMLFEAALKHQTMRGNDFPPLIILRCEQRWFIIISIIFSACMLHCFSSLLCHVCTFCSDWCLFVVTSGSVSFCLYLLWWVVGFAVAWNGTYWAFFSGGNFPPSRKRIDCFFFSK